MGEIRNDIYLGNYGPIDGTVEFYGRIQALVERDSVVLNIGAGRGSWYYEDYCVVRRELQNFKGAVAKYICADIDPIVLSNPTSDENILIINGLLDLPNESVDLVICDWVFEHVVDPVVFGTEIRRILKVGGIIAARTPHKYNYVSLMARLIPNKHHSKLLLRIQPRRKSVDVFPTIYRMNTKFDLKKSLGNFDDFTYLYRSEPTYNFGNMFAARIVERIETIAPKFLVSQLFVFKVKQPDKDLN